MTGEKEEISKNIDNPRPCVSCGGIDFSLLFLAPDFDTGKISFQLTRCKSCDLIRTEPMFDNNELEKYYSLPYYGSGKTKFIGIAETLTYVFNYIRASSILSHLHNRQEFPANASPRILDIGCGRGNLLKTLKGMGCDCYGVERMEFPISDYSQDIHIYKEKLEDIIFAERFFDAVVIWHVLEHLDNPIQIVQEAVRILRPGGILAVAVPNFGSFQARIFRGSWFHLDLPRHRYHFTSETLLRCLSKNGFRTISQHTFSIEQNPFGFIQSFFNKIMPFKEPNRFYSLLKNMQGPSAAINFLLWAVFTSFVFPFAVLEYFISGLLGKGATFIIYAKKC
jgi:2-polyprenyl-3-methyl-5-hydroxy-6-metoxy-1,4-benzoquinol methylase